MTTKTEATVTTTTMMTVTVTLRERDGLRGVTVRGGRKKGGDDERCGGEKPKERSDGSDGDKVRGCDLLSIR